VGFGSSRLVSSIGPHELKTGECCKKDQEVHDVNGWEFPGHRWFEDKIDKAQDPGIERTPYSIDGICPISAEIGIANIQITDPVCIHGLTFHRCIGV
jgi:hypothetical protein